jgi:HSP20 family protein
MGAFGLTPGLSANLYEHNGSYILQVPLPGAKPDQFTITARDNVVMLQATTELTPPEGARPIFQAATGGQFREQVVLPGDVDPDKVSAQYQDGILTLRLPKSQHAREKTITVQTGGARR